MHNSERLQRTMDRFIELYGDRTEGIGSEIRAGFAWIQRTQFVLIAGDEAGVRLPSSWRRLSRLLNLAQQFGRPVLLWDLSFEVTSAMTSGILLNQNTIQKSLLHLLNLPSPIIHVFDRLAQKSVKSDSVMGDVAVLVESKDIDSHHLSIPKGENWPTLVKVTNSSLQIRPTILELLNQMSTIPAETLIHHRIDRARKIVEQSH